ncbi:tyrosine-protein phosphatase [Paenibacillus cymbidii]|uniref:tyrosine-protein phosphatase n=1 Tax=Paenibacillus cymbidii TaxID=1639034 RepID=UPI001F1A4F78|nr:tyrosine-protein phosphatase [Paenibacillus cymbidii]
MNPASAYTRVLPVEGAFNVRDLGGYATKDGGTTRWGAFLRADGLHKLSDDSRTALIGRGVGTVIDLRHAGELLDKRNVFADDSRVAYHHVSLINPTSLATRQAASLADLYIGMLEGSKAELLRVFTVLAEHGGAAALYHCAAGKDRTGVVSALLLELAGVPHETIVEDYSLTAECLVPIMDELRGDRPAGMTAEMYEAFIGCAPANMKAMLQYLTERYEDAERYLLAIGLPADKVQAIKAKLVS